MRDVPLPREILTRESLTRYENDSSIPAVIRMEDESEILPAKKRKKNHKRRNDDKCSRKTKVAKRVADLKEPGCIMSRPEQIALPPD